MERATSEEHLCFSSLNDLLEEICALILLYIVVGIYYTQGLFVWWSLKKIFVILQDFFKKNC